MRRALELAAREHPHPNPRVGAVILGPDGSLLAEGAHRGPGQPHAEIEALQNLPDGLPQDSTLVTTLEPCSVHGRTPPCSTAIVAAGIRRVVVGAIDPDRRVSGAGVAELQEAGVDVATGVLAEEVEAMDPGYFTHRRQGRARFTVKTAMTLDGQTAARDGSSRWITSPEARADAHQMRAQADAVMVGAGALRADDPLLTARIPGYEGPQPAAVVVAGRQRLPATARLWERGNVIVFATEPVEPASMAVVVPAGEGGHVDLLAVARELGERGHLSVLVEGGATLLASLWAAGMVDAGVTYVGAHLAGGSGIPVAAGPWETIDDAHRATIHDVRRIGSDLRIDWTTVQSGGSEICPDH